MTAMFLFCKYIQIYQVEMLDIRVSHHALCDLYGDFRQMCSRYIEEHPVTLGISIASGSDESMFGKKKYHRRKKNKRCWVFGMVQREEPKLVLQIVPDRKKATLLAILKKHVVMEATVFHDERALYRLLHEHGYTHGVVNHSKEFKSEEGVCTNTIEGIWGNVKEKIAAMHGLRQDNLQSFLDEFTYRFMYARGQDMQDMFPHYIKHKSKCIPLQ